MRFDNPIYNHNFKNRYDIASFEELKNEYRQNRNIDCSYLKKYFQNNNFEKFNHELENIIKLSYANKKRDPHEIEHYIKWKNKLDRYFNFYQNFKVNSLKIRGNKNFNYLYNNGFSFHEIPQKNIQFIKNKLSKKIKKLFEKKSFVKEGMQDNYERREILNKKWLDILNKVYEEEGILSAIRAYYNKKDMKVESASLRILTDEDVSPLQFLRDCKTVPKHTNLHTDPLEGYMTSIIYLSDVKEGEGGTQFFPKSHRYMYDDLQEIFARSVSTGNYCFNEYSRAVLFRLPKFLRVTKNWGRLVEKGSKMEKYLDRNMVHFISKKNGNCSIFEAGAILHNAIVTKGKRIAIQVLFH